MARRLMLSLTMSKLINPKLTFLGVPATDLQTLRGADVVIFGAGEATPLQRGARGHAAAAPSALRETMQRASKDLLRWDFEQENTLLPEGLAVFDIGDLATEPANPELNQLLIASATASILDLGAIPVLLGGGGRLRTHPVF